MSSSDHQLAPPPLLSDRLDTWLTHVAGFILFEDVRNYAIRQLDPGLDEVARAAALKAVNDTTYGLMMALEGVSGTLRGNNYAVEIHGEVRLVRRADDAVVMSLPMEEGEGLCMGFHGWLEDDYGSVPITL